MNQAFRTLLIPEEFPLKLNHKDGIISMGSCFADHLGNKLQHYKFKVHHRPYGIIYSPLLIAHNLRNTISGVSFDERYLVENNGLWHSFLHHGSFSTLQKNKLVEKIEKSEKTLKENLKTAKLLIITLGSSYTYFYKKGGFVVANCHKIPAAEFDRKLISHQRTFSELNMLVKALAAFNPDIKIVLSVSPVRHLKDGFHQNQLSKAHLLLACNQLVEENKQVFYFPAFELLLDELRDYRFYAEDMLHPNSTAVGYIWEKWATAYLSNRCQDLLKDIDAVQKGLSHRPLHPEIGVDIKLQKNLLKKIEILKEKEPTLDFTEELKRLNQR